MASKDGSLKSIPATAPSLKGPQKGDVAGNSPVAKPQDKVYQKLQRRLTNNLSYRSPQNPSVTFLVDIGPQVSALKIEDSPSCGIIHLCKATFVVDNFGNTQLQITAKVGCWLPRE